MKPISALLVLLSAVLLAPAAQAQFLPNARPGEAKSNQPAMIDRIVAEVEGNVILQSDLDEAVQTTRRQYASDPQKLPPPDVLRRSVLNQLIIMQLQVQHAGEQGIRVSNDEISNAIANIATNNKMTAEQLRQAIISNGGNFSAFARRIADNIMVQKLRNQVVKKKVQVTDAEVDNLLKSPSFDAADAHIAHIDILLPNGATPSDIAAARAKAEEVEKAIKGGMDFASAAIQYSGAQDALKGGDLGWRAMSSMAPGLAAVVADLKPGQITPPLRAANGYHIFKLIGRREANRDVVTEYHARQILIKPSELQTPAQAQQEAETIYKQLTGAKPEDFATVAKSKSDDDTSANLGGDLGWFQLDDHGPAVAKALSSLKDGEVSRPFKTTVGWDIVQRIATRERDVTDQARRQRAHQEIAQRKAEQAYDDFVRQLRSSSYVNIRIPALRDPSKQATTNS